MLAIFINYLVAVLRQEMSFLIYQRHLIKFGAGIFSTNCDKIKNQVTSWVSSPIAWSRKQLFFLFFAILFTDDASLFFIKNADSSAKDLNYDLTKIGNGSLKWITVFSFCYLLANPATLGAGFRGGVGPIPVGGNSPLIGGWTVWPPVIQH